MTRTSEGLADAKLSVGNEATDYVPSWRVQRVPVRGGNVSERQSEAPVLVSTNVWAIKRLPGERIHDLFERRCAMFEEKAKPALGRGLR